MIWRESRSLGFRCINLGGYVVWIDVNYVNGVKKRDAKGIYTWI
jgi:hypothetical protein